MKVSFRANKCTQIKTRHGEMSAVYSVWKRSSIWNQACIFLLFYFITLFFLLLEVWPRFSDRLLILLLFYFFYAFSWLSLSNFLTLIKRMHIKIIKQSIILKWTGQYDRHLNNTRNCIQVASLSFHHYLLLSQSFWNYLNCLKSRFFVIVGSQQNFTKSKKRRMHMPLLYYIW